MHNPIDRTTLWFQKARPEPTTQDFHVQLGCHFEEVVEMIDTLAPLTNEADALIKTARTALHNLGEHLKTSGLAVHVLDSDRVNYLDALCDQIVTAIGCAHNSRLDIIAAYDEVNRSNFSKFDADGNPFFDANGKIQKGPRYRKAHLTPFI